MAREEDAGFFAQLRMTSFHSEAGMADKKFEGTPKKATTHVNQNEDLIFEKSSPGKKAYRLAELDVPAVDAASHSLSFLE